VLFVSSTDFSALVRNTQPLKGLGPTSFLIVSVAPLQWVWASAVSQAEMVEWHEELQELKMGNIHQFTLLVPR